MNQENINEYSEIPVNEIAEFTRFDIDEDIIFELLDNISNIGTKVITSVS